MSILNELSAKNISIKTARLKQDSFITTLLKKQIYTLLRNFGQISEPEFYEAFN